MEEATCGREAPVEVAEDYDALEFKRNSGPATRGNICVSG